ncbi:MAG: hypothetical protein ACD_41C00168G0001, partial [uncultured bacterium]
MKRLAVVGLSILCVGIVFADIVSWSLPAVAFSFSFSLVLVGVAAHSVPWPRSAWLAIALGAGLDLFSPAPFGTGMISLVLL